MNEDDSNIAKGIFNGCGFLLAAWAVIIAICLMFCGCKTVERENIVTKTDTVRIYSQHKDSVVYRDSVFVHLYEKGDTVYSITERWNVRYNDRVRVDTVYKVREVAQQSKDVTEKKEPWYERLLPWLLVILLGAISLLSITKK